MQINTITLSNTLPRVFCGLEHEAPICDSQVWLRQLQFDKGKYYIIEAESGTGKSSLCSYIYGNRRDYEGTISFNGKDISTLSVAEWCEIRRRSLAILPQEMRVFPELTAVENIQLKNRLTDFATEEEIRQMLAAFEIEHKADSPVGRLSIGQQQRVAIVRTLCQPFTFILLDEPVSHLDARNNLIAAKMILAAARKQDAAIIATSVGNPLQLESDIIKISL